MAAPRPVAVPLKNLERTEALTEAVANRLVDLAGALRRGDLVAAAPYLTEDFSGSGPSSLQPVANPDLFVTAIQGQSHLLFRNEVGTRTGHGFLKVRLRATKGPPQAVGAIVRVRAAGRVQIRELSAGSGFLSQHPGELLFGLGSAKQATLEVRWPGRAVERFGRVPAGSRLRLVEGAGRPVRVP